MVKVKKTMLVMVLFVAISLVFTGCGKASELSKELKAAKKTYDKVKKIADDSDTYDKMGESLGKVVELTGDNLERYFRFVKKANEEVEGVDFSNPSIATLLYAQKTGEPLDGYVDKSGIIKWDEYASVGTTILKSSGEIMGLQFTQGLLSSQKEGLTNINETLAKEDLAKESRTTLENQKAEMEKSISKLEDSVNSDTYQKLIKLQSLIEEKKSAAGF